MWQNWHDLSVADRIRLYRTWLDFSMEELASKSGVSASHLSKIERGISDPSVSVLQRIAAGLNITAAALLADPSSSSSPLPSQSTNTNLQPTVVRKNERKRLQPPNSDIYYELLTPDLQRQLEFTWVTHPARHQSKIFSHDGEESLLCLQGSVRVIVGDCEFILQAGDCISFDSSLPHRIINETDTEATLISAQTPASF
jgi:transcriptional regulator with XRE-family HTH domain